MKRARRGEFDIGKMIISGLIIGVIFVAWTFAPYFVTKWKMGEVVQVCLLRWRDTREMGAAQTCLPDKFEREEISEEVTPEDCELFEQEGRRHLECYWKVEVKYPLVDKSKTMEFLVSKYLDSGDKLHDWGG